MALADSRSEHSTVAGAGELAASPTSLTSTSLKRKRASRKGQPPKFHCSEAGCGKSYTRAEHLARHQLNHSPKQVYCCQEVGCDNTFVRLDLYERHRARHESQATQQNDSSSWELLCHDQSMRDQRDAGFVDGSSTSQIPLVTVPDAPLLPSGGGTGAINGQLMLSQQTSYEMYGYDQPDSFATWLFDSPDSQNAG